MTAYGIAFGSNLGDRAAHLEAGLERLQAQLPGARLLARAGWYETEPVDCAPGTQAFLNSVVEIESALPPAAVHAQLQIIEQALGRPREREKNAPRPLDLDVLYAGECVSDVAALVLPHPRLHLRRFVLAPLAEIRPDLILPGQTCSIAELLATLDDDPAAVRRLGDWGDAS
jgi:2-amino-4-hydroxy-6-hydroxymethyldihydropteridine diphosphokinase